uniref:Uncharacterized protein n=1 Tax=Chromera velia CCMP2878 TaxID=1169474 RepID=A0A0G4ICH8_9ALVE|eukprot:Cvel_13042.t1-p1 / transcript=Cvel_13042.t1 / gene=Cvel_13042 / organism=Chromera_velia_CCMP2878 / gene_product=Phosphatidylinositol glycan anchor biosynthesis, putative / transcript_product=Phosphatidylinositol glycan anchor biosynthesis, putative / location=Cvel_scaffold876:21926-27818(-) / protein_length=648 / sequence_SO=supercontig / SO=protein_coding / is_pseudo=false
MSTDMGGKMGLRHQGLMFVSAILLGCLLRFLTFCLVSSFSQEEGDDDFAEPPFYLGLLMGAAPFSFGKLREAFARRKLGVSPYAGGTFHLPPWLLWVLDHTVTVAVSSPHDSIEGRSSPYVSAWRMFVFLLLCDVATSSALFILALASNQSQDSSHEDDEAAVEGGEGKNEEKGSLHRFSEKEKKAQPSIVAASFFMNPLTIASQAWALSGGGICLCLLSVSTAAAALPLCLHGKTKFRFPCSGVVSGRRGASLCAAFAVACLAATLSLFPLPQGLTLVFPLWNLLSVGVFGAGGAEGRKEKENAVSPVGLGEGGAASVSGGVEEKQEGKKGKRGKAEGAGKSTPGAVSGSRSQKKGICGDMEEETSSERGAEAQIGTGMGKEQSSFLLGARIEKRREESEVVSVPSSLQAVLVHLGSWRYWFGFWVFLLSVLGAFSGLTLMSAALMGGDWEFWKETSQFLNSVGDTTPSLGIFWYTFQLVFTRFRLLFLCAFQGHLLINVLPLWSRFASSGVDLAIISLSSLLLFHPYTSSADFALMLSLAACNWEAVRRSEAFAALLVASVFGLSVQPVMASLWLERNTGNANFLFNMCLVQHIFAGFLLVEWTRAAALLQRKRGTVDFVRRLLDSCLDVAVSGKVREIERMTAKS